LTPARRLAVRFMLLGAALEVVAAAVFALTGNTMAPFFAKRSAGQGSIHAQIIMQDKVQVPVYLVAALSWLVLAAANRRSWRRRPHLGGDRVRHLYPRVGAPGQSRPRGPAEFRGHDRSGPAHLAGRAGRGGPAVRR
ncbi:MAG: hypothetical protein ACYCPF_10805, partial [Streptosporangiaceae bacterium]